MRYFLAGLAGACCGYFACTFAANLEKFQFLAIRQWVTGKTSVSEITNHPADKWIVPALVSFFSLVGAGLGMFILWRFQSWRGTSKKSRVENGQTARPS